MHMKKYAVLALHSCFYITALLFFPDTTSIFTAGFLISILALENIWFIILPLCITFFIPISHIYILVAVLCYHILLYPFIKRNRYYALGVYALSSITTFTVLTIVEGFHINTIYIMLYLFIIYCFINILFYICKIFY